MPPSANKPPKVKGKASTAATQKQETRKKRATPEQEKPKPDLAEGMNPHKDGPKKDWRLAFAVPKRPAHRPSTYDPSFHPQDYVELSRLGNTKAQICAAWGISRDTLHRWGQEKEKHPGLSDAIKEGDELRTAWWINFSTRGCTGNLRGFQQTMTIYLMNNICAKDFRARVEHTHSLDIEEMDWGD